MAEENAPRQYFMDNQQMDFETQCILGGCCYGSGEVGEILATVDRIVPGDFESWVVEWLATAERVEGMAAGSAAAGNRASARRAFLRAATYYSACLAMIDGSKDPERRLPIWKKHMECFDRFCARLDTPAVKVEIPYESTPMPGYFFAPDGSGGPFATIIFNNGSDGPTSSMWGAGVAGALERGYAALIFDGPGQNALLWLHDIGFRADWEKVITPVVDFLLTRPDVDPARIALSGLSQGGYWVLRALAFEHRVVAGIVDPGVIDVATVMKSKWPPEMLQPALDGKEEEFNSMVEGMMQYMSDEQRQEFKWRMRPYVTDNYYVWVRSALDHQARDVIDRITCPMFVADPDDEQFWPGQSREVYDGLNCPKTIVSFTREEGANWHCEPKARALYDQRMFDWLATVMPA